MRAEAFASIRLSWGEGSGADPIVRTQTCAATPIRRQTGSKSRAVSIRFPLPGEPVSFNEARIWRVFHALHAGRSGSGANHKRHSPGSDYAYAAKFELCPRFSSQHASSATYGGLDRAIRDLLALRSVVNIKTVQRGDAVYLSSTFLGRP